MIVIPKMEEPRWYTVREFINSDFFEIKTDETFEVDMQYPLLQMRHAERSCFVRNEVYILLKEAAGLLPNGYKFRIWDAWRPFLLQKELYERYSADIIKKFGLEIYPEEKKKEVISKFVSVPIEDIAVPPVHTTGGAIDVTLLGPDGNELDMGTAFDDFTEKTYTAYYENKDNNIIRDNRRLLYSVMTKAGFTNLPSEWWHYDYGDRFWAYYRKKAAIYKGVFTKENICNKRRI